MAVNRAEGIGHYNNGGDWTALGHNYSGVNISWHSTGGRGGRGYINIGVNSNAHVVLRSSESEVYAHAAFNADARTHIQFFEFRNSSVSHLIIDGYEDGSIGILRASPVFSTIPFAETGATLIAISDPGIWRAGTWHQIQIKMIPNSGAGECTIRVDGIQILSFTGNTYGGSGASSVSSFGMGTGFGASNVSYGDIVIVDTKTVDDLGQTTGHVSYLGDAAVYDSVAPVDGAWLEWARSTGAGTWSSHVDDNPKNDDTDYLRSTVDGQRMSFSFPAVSSSIGTIIAMKAVVAHKKEDASFGSIKLLARDSGGTEHDGPAKAMIQDYIFDQLYIEKDPLDASALTATKVNNTQLGFKNNSGT